MPERPTTPGRTESHVAIALAVVALIGSIVTGFIAAHYADLASARSTNTQLVELAVSILREPPKRNAVDIREWAMNILDAASASKLPRAARLALKDSVPLYARPVTATPKPTTPRWEPR
jgi:hypothetical protein